MQANANWENQLLDLAGHISLPHSPQLLSYLAEEAALHSAYREAEKITSAHSKSFYLASALLTHEKRTAVRALYAFCRTVDDIVDESAAQDRLTRLGYWRDVVQRGSSPDANLVALAWADTLTRYHIPRHYALQLIDGVARDLSQSRYQTFNDLATYCYGVASTVGLMSMHIVGFKSHEAVPYAIKLGVALQMTNILRDVGADFRNGRIYLPLEELTAYGIREEDIAAGVVTDNWRKFMQYQIERTRHLYKESWVGIKMLEREGQLAIGAASTLYENILEDIEEHDYNVFTRRASLSAWEKIASIPKIWIKVNKVNSAHATH